MSLTRILLDLSHRHMAALPDGERRDFEDELDRLRMLRIAEDGLAVGDHLPDFELQDGRGQVWRSEALLNRGPLVLALFRGDWCPYCDVTMSALDAARPTIETLGATAIGIMPERPEYVAQTAERRRLSYPLLSDPANRFAGACGLVYDLSPEHIKIHRRRSRDFPGLHGDVAWRLPIPAVFVVDPSARVVFAFSDADPARWPDPEELLASLHALRDAPALSKR